MQLSLAFCEHNRSSYCKCKVKADLAVVITSVEGVMSMPSFLTQVIRKRKP